MASAALTLAHYGHVWWLHGMAFQVRVCVCVGVYERRQEKHTDSVLPSAFLRAKTAGLDQRERNEFPR